MLDDNTIILGRLKEGDKDAFNLIYAEYAPKIYLRLLKLVKQPVLVEELLQDVFIKVWKHRASIDASKGFVSYMNHIADNIAIDFYRKVQRDKKLQFEIWASAIELYYHTEEYVVGRETKAILESAINSLSPKKREILILNKFHDKSYKEIAESLNISISTVSNQLVQAMKDIRTFIHRNYSNELISSVVFCFMIDLN